MPDAIAATPRRRNSIFQRLMTLHFWLAYAFLSLIGLHILAQWKVVKANWRRFRGFVHKRFRNPL